MGQKKQYQVKAKQAIKRKRRRDKLTKAGIDPNKSYIDGMYIGIAK